MVTSLSAPTHSQGHRQCIAVVTHVLNAAIQSVYERIKRERPFDHDVWMILSTDDPTEALCGVPETSVVRISKNDIFSFAYPRKCANQDWEMAGNLDLVFLEFRRRMPSYEQYWFIEYDVHWEGVWEALFENFRSSQAGVLAATIHTTKDLPHKLEALHYPEHVIPVDSCLSGAETIKAFLPICRLSSSVLDALDIAYRDGIGGHYEIMIPTVAARYGLGLEDFGGSGKYVKAENLNRFYFARASSFSHSPGNFVFRPEQRVLPRRNTLWHPVKPGGVPLWLPLKFRGNYLKNVVEILKPTIYRVVIWVWFATRWRPLVVDKK